MPVTLKKLARTGSWRELAPLAGSVGGYFGAIAAEFHAAPAAGGVFGGVMEMQDTGFALTQAMRIEVGEKVGGGIGDRGEQIRRLAGLETRLLSQGTVDGNQLRWQRILSEKAIQIREHTGG